MRDAGKGWRTIVTTGLGVVFAVAPLLGVEVTTEQQQEIGSAVFIIVAFLLRFDTNTPVGRKY